ncbi:MAG: hypothetical protein AVDCRST_MAG87-2353, partial [uncultured Thermomicrobiales bacterium]
ASAFCWCEHAIGTYHGRRFSRRIQPWRAHARTVQECAAYQAFPGFTRVQRARSRFEWPSSCGHRSGRDRRTGKEVRIPLRSSTPMRRRNSPPVSVGHVVRRWRDTKTFIGPPCRQL